MSKGKIFVVEGKIGIKFAVTGDNELKAKEVAYQHVKNTLNNAQIGSFGYTFIIEKVTEYKPVK